jgi:excisionase family DNA binding protein
MASRAEYPRGASAIPSRSPRLSNRGGNRSRIKFFTIKEVAEFLRVAIRTVRRWIDAGDLVAHRFGSVVRIAEDDLLAFCARHRET